MPELRGMALQEEGESETATMVICDEFIFAQILTLSWRVVLFGYVSASIKFEILAELPQGEVALV